MSVETTLRALIKTHYRKLINYKVDTDFKKLKLDHIIENYYMNSIKFPNRTNYTDWIVIELIKEPKDVLLVPNEDVLRGFRDFKNPIYKDVSKSIFESIVGRIFVSGNNLEEDYDASKFKVIVLDYTNTRYKVKLSKYIATNFPKTELVLGIN